MRRGIRNANGMHFHIRTGMPARLALDMAGFARKLDARWSGATVMPNPALTGAIAGGEWFFAWPELPLVPKRDRVVSGGIRWLLTLL